MKKDINVFLKHILECIDAVENYTRGMRKEKFLQSSETQDAVIRRITVIGEAVRHIPASFRNKHADIPWLAAAGMRDKLVHDYFGVSLNITWDVVKKDLPKLKKLVANLLEE